MKIVGDHLAKVAAASGNSTEMDLFSRSAFNRYYYSAFLLLRDVLKSIDPAWATPTHQSLPEVLKGQVLKRLKREIKRAHEAGLIPQARGDVLYRTATTAASELSNLLISARETRRLADYEPETLVLKQAGTMKLGQYTIDRAQNWERRVDAQAKTILKIYGELGLI